MKKFVKSSELQLVGPGYLTIGGDANQAVTNNAFVAAQKRAEYVVTFARHCEGKDFEGKKADSIADIKKAVAKELSATSTQYVDVPEKVTQELNERLKEEALKFVEYQDEVEKVEKINAFLQEFNILHEFEEFGLYFEEGITKLNKIYTMADVTNAVKKTIDLLA